MSSAGLIIGLLLLTAVVIWVLLPVFRPGGTRLAPDALLREKQRERLHVYYERTLRNLHDLDEDHTLGKLDAEAYTAEREYWVQRGMAALRALDALDGQAESAAASSDSAEPTAPILAATPADATAVDSAIDAAIEAAVARYRGMN